MDDRALSVEQLDALSRAVPEDAERRDLLAYLAVGRTCLKPCCAHLTPLVILFGAITWSPPSGLFGMMRCAQGVKGGTGAGNTCKQQHQ